MASMVFNVVVFTWGVKGDGGFRREVNGLEAVLGCRVEEVGGCAVQCHMAGSRRRRDLRWETRSWATWAKRAGKQGEPGWHFC
jgi:hypothetical protein